MPSLYSQNLALELIGTGDQAGVWGNTTNTNLGTLIEQAISGYVTQAVATGTDTTITIPNGATGVARNMYIELTGTGGASTNLIVPANKKLYFIFNNTASGQVTVKVSGQTGVSVPNKAKMILVSNGTDIVVAENYIADLTANSLTISSGTANGVLYLDGSKVATSGSALTFNGSVLATTGRFEGGANLGLLLNNATGAYAAWQYNSTNVGEIGVASQLIGGGGTDDFAINTRQAAGDIVFGINTSEAMRLTSTGLGIGTSSPAYKLDVAESGAPTSTNTFSVARISGSDAVANDLTLLGPNTSQVRIKFGDPEDATIGEVGYNHSTNSLRFVTSGSERAVIDSSGNLGLGVSPSAWNSSYKVMDVSAWGSIAGEFGTQGTISLVSNCFANSTGYDNWTYKNTAPATRYKQYNGAHQWFTAPSGTAGNTITFTQAMTLDASGNLGVGTASPSNRLELYASGNTLASVSNASGGVGYFGVVGTALRLTNLNASSATEILGNGQIRISTAGGSPVTIETSGTERARITAAGNVVAGGSVALATTATDGFLYVPTCAGTPTGTPTAITGMAPIVVDTTNNKLYFYSGGQWRDAGP